jgi:hypothetical protein
VQQAQTHHISPYNQIPTFPTRPRLIQIRESLGDVTIKPEGCNENQALPRKKKKKFMAIIAINKREHDVKLTRNQEQMGLYLFFNDV